MKRLIFIFTFLYSAALTASHDVPVAVFHITASDATIQIDVTFDLEDFSESLDISMNKVNVEIVQNYLNKNTNFQFNDQTAKLTISELKIVRGHIRAKGFFEEVAKSVETIKIENTCLNNVPRHSNVIQVDLNNRSRDFRMHDKRTAINLEY